MQPALFESFWWMKASMTICEMYQAMIDDTESIKERK